MNIRKSAIISLCLFALLAAAEEGVAGGLRDTSNRADYIIIAPADYFPIAQRLAKFRHEKDGFATQIVDVESVISEFGSVASPDTALKKFIQYTIHSWSDPKPQYFLLAGNVNAVPSHPERENLIGSETDDIDTLLMIDQWFVDVFNSNGTLGVDASIGRLPAWDSIGLSVMVDKIVRYETDPAGEWCSRAITLSDYNQTNGDIFERDARSIRMHLAQLWNDTISVEIRSDSPLHLDSAAFLDLWNRGAGIVTYSGHASPVALSATHYFTTNSIGSLTDSTSLPVCLFGGCDLSFDTGPDVSIPTHLLAQKGGGAVAVVSSEGLIDEYTPVVFYIEMLQSLQSDPNRTLGEAYREAMPEWQWQTYRRITLLGDPALHVKRPASAMLGVAPAAAPQAFELNQNFPNPFNPTTAISYKLSAVSFVTMSVYDLLGRKVCTLVNGQQAAGRHTVTFNAGGLQSGIYLCRISVIGISGRGENSVGTLKLVLLK